MKLPYFNIHRLPRCKSVSGSAAITDCILILESALNYRPQFWKAPLNSEWSINQSNILISHSTLFAKIQYSI